MGKKGGKKPTSKIPTSKKKPRKDPNLMDPLSKNPAWQTDIIDLEGRWGWKKLDPNVFFTDILPKIRDFERMKWHEILGRKHHEVETWKIITEAQKRLEKLKLDDTEQLVSLRLTGRQRLWGIRIENICKILWWDPEHEICPSKLKHT